MNEKQAIKKLEKILLNTAGEQDCEAIELAIKILKGDCLFDRIDAMFKQSLADTQDAETFCDEHMEGETVCAMYQFGLDHAGNDKYLFAIMADFANSRINGK